MERGQCIQRDSALAATMVFSMANGTLMLRQNVVAIAQTEQEVLEKEAIEAAIIYLTR